MQRHILTVVVAGFLVGVFIQSVFREISLGFLWISASVGVCFLCGSLLRQNILNIFFLVFLFWVSLSGGFWRSYQVNQKAGDVILEKYSNETVTFLAQITEDPDERQYSTKLTVEPQILIFDDEEISLEGKTKVLVTIDSHYLFHYGDTLRISGKLKKPDNFITDSGREFNYEQYLSKDDIFYTMSFVQIEPVTTNGGFFIKRWMLALKNIFVERINQFFPQPEGALLAGVLFGEQAGLGQKLQDDFRKTGIVHIVVLSGFNVTIVAIFIVWFLRRFLSQNVALFFGILGIVLFALLVGAGATIIRASAMAILAIIARLIGREYDVIRALFFAAFLMVLQNPRILLYDISFQLSFLATLSLIYFAPVIERYFGWVTESLTLRETVVSTFAAQIFVLPLLLYSVGEFSLVSPIVNILVVPWVSLTMLLGFISALLGLISSGLGMAFMIPTYCILFLQIKVVEFFGGLPFASIIVPEFPVWLLVLVYGALSVWMVKLHLKQEIEPLSPPS
jgi:competence protein ComEC